MRVTLSLVATTITLTGIGIALRVSRYRKLDGTLKSLSICFKFD